MKSLACLFILCVACLVSSCSEMGMDIAKAIDVQQQVINDNEDALEASKCVKVNAFHGDHGLMVLYVDTKCLEPIVKEKADKSDDE